MKVLLTPIVLLALLLVGAMDYQDQLDDQAFYCKEVYEKLYPDYRGNYGQLCDSGKVKVQD